LRFTGEVVIPKRWAGRSHRQALLAGDRAAAASLLQQLAADPEAAWLRPFIQALQAIVAGSRDRSRADAPDLDYSMAAEILFLIETLENQGR
jgi:hypothetical protein